MTRQELYDVIAFLNENVQTVTFPGSETTFTYVNPKSIYDIADHIGDYPEDYAQKVRVSADYTMDDVVTILSDGFAESCAFENVDYVPAEYKKAKAKLLEDGCPERDLCLELVQAQMLIMGYDLALYEVETHAQHFLTLEKLIKGLDLYVAQIMKRDECNKMRAILNLFEQGDFYDYESVLQLAIFGEIIYG